MGQQPEVDARGFTLLELIVTLVVVAVAVGLVAPTIGRSTEALRVRAEVAGFAATFRHAREQAITTRRAFTVGVDPGGRRRAFAVGARAGDHDPAALHGGGDPDESSPDGDDRRGRGPVDARALGPGRARAPDAV